MGYPGRHGGTRSALRLLGILLGLAAGFAGVALATAQCAVLLQTGQWPSLPLSRLAGDVLSILLPDRQPWPIRPALAAPLVELVGSIPATPVLIGIGALTAWVVLAGADRGVPARRVPDLRVDPDEIRSRIAGDTLIIVSRRYPALLGAFRHEFKRDREVRVLLDRRRGDRRVQARPYPAERRRGDRRDPAGPEQDLRVHPYALIPVGGPPLLSLDALDEPGA